MEYDKPIEDLLKRHGALLYPAPELLERTLERLPSAAPRRRWRWLLLVPAMTMLMALLIPAATSTSFDDELADEDEELFDVFAALDTPGDERILAGK